MKHTAGTNTILRFAFVLTCVATAGSLYFSEILKFPPCSLCWYQRVFMYPLVVLYLVDLLRNENKSFYYSVPLIAIGLVFSLYHNLLYYGVMPADIIPCTEGASCTAKQLEWLGFITIPLLSSLGFITLLVINLFGLQALRREESYARQ